MGFSQNLTPDDWKVVRKEKKIDTASSYSDIFKTTVVKGDYLPRGVIRESRDSELHPCTSAFVFGLDSTGSMSRIYKLVAQKFGVLVLKLFEDNVVPDPQIMFAAIDDSFHCDTPLQITQFEVDRRIVDQFTDLKYTGRGGGNDFESYQLLWYFCARHTSIDCYEKRGRKGFLITVGDDGYPDRLTKKEIYDVFGDTVADDIPTESLLDEINKKYDVYHISLKQGGSYSEHDMSKWEKLLGSHAISLSDYESLPELIISLIKVHYGSTIDEATKEWDNTTMLVVRESLQNMLVKQGDNTGLVKF